MTEYTTLENLVRCADSVYANFPGETFFGGIGFIELHVQDGGQIYFLFMNEYYRWSEETDIVEKVDVPFVGDKKETLLAANFRIFIKEYEKIRQLMVDNKIPNEICSADLDKMNREIRIHTSTKVIVYTGDDDGWVVR